MNEVKYYLVLEKRLGDYNLIDINKLDICNIPVTSNIATIDNFTINFTEEEIKESIKRSNMLETSYLDGDLKIISDVKHNFRVISKDVFELIKDFQNNNEIIPQDLKNKLFGSYKKIVENIFEDQGFIKGLLERFKYALKSNDKQVIFQILEELPYSRSRNIYLNIYDYYHKTNNKIIENVQTNETSKNYYKAQNNPNYRVLEKLND